MSSGREKEWTTAADCSFSNGILHASPDQPWEVKETTGMDEDEKLADDTGTFPCTTMEQDTTLRIAPIQQQFGGWDDAHFHSSLRLPMECSLGKGVVVTLEAMARECVAVAISSKPYYDMGKTYVVHFGASGNVSTVVRRHVNGTEAIDVTLPSRVCQERSFVHYWICLTGGYLFVGIGNVPGQHCIGKLDDTLYQQLRSPLDAVRFVGLGNSALGRNARPSKVRNVMVSTVPSFLVDTLSALPADMPFCSADQVYSSTNGNNNNGNAAADDEEETNAMLKEYQEECRKQRARAAKFDIPYKEPAPQAFLKWSQARRLRANPEKGFITGLDVTSSEEIAKQNARKERFLAEAALAAAAATNKRGSDEMDEQEDNNVNGMMEGEEEEKEQPPLHILQAWDNEELVRQHRMDLPRVLWKDPLSSAAAEEEDATQQEMDEIGDFALEAKPDPIAVPEKIHICSMDWAAFKQIRTGDIMAYFKNYGPSYVEWLGELSCNVLFEDKYSAARALNNMSQELPSPPPAEVVPATTTTTAITDAALTDAANNSDTENDQEMKPQEGEKPTTSATNVTNDSSSKLAPPDLGNMGWRLCNLPIRKAQNDRFGRRGTISRVLMRVASNFDMLVERPTSWPKPPPGFTTKRILGPGSDFDTQPRKKKRRKKNPTHENRNNGAYDFSYDESSTPNNDGDPSAMDRGLSSGRGGFSVEELEAERAAKREQASAAAVADDVSGAETKEGVEGYHQDWNMN